MDKLKKINGKAHQLLGFLQAQWTNSEKDGYIDFDDTIQYKLISDIIDYLNNVLNSE